MTPLNIANDIGIVEFWLKFQYFLLNRSDSTSFLSPSIVHSNSNKTLIDPCIILDHVFLVPMLDLDSRGPNGPVLKCSQRKKA